MKWKPKARRPEFRDCLHCGDTFEVERERASAKTCSVECSREWRKRQQCAYHAQNLKENGEAINARRRENYAENPEPVLARNDKWQKGNRPEINARLRRKYADEKGEPVRAWHRRDAPCRNSGLRDPS